MFFAAAEERGDNLLDGRGDAYCGMLNASYNQTISSPFTRKINKHFSLTVSLFPLKHLII